MLELFVIFSKSGIVVFNSVHRSLEEIINGLVKHVFLEDRAGQYQINQLQIKYHMDNEFELMFVVGYQKFLQLSYVDKFLDDVHLAFRDKYSDFDLRKILNSSFNSNASELIKMSERDGDDDYDRRPYFSRRKTLELSDLLIDLDTSILDFGSEVDSTYEACVRNYSSLSKKETMRLFRDSVKSKKTIASMIVQQKGLKINQKEMSKQSKKVEPAVPKQTAPIVKESENVPPGVKAPSNIFAKLASRTGDSKVVKKAKKESSEPSKKGKAARQWTLSGSNPDEFDFSKKSTNAANEAQPNTNTASIIKNIASTLSPEELETNLEMTDSESSDEEEDFKQEDNDAAGVEKLSKSSYFGSIWKSISYNKTLTQDDLKSVLDQLRDHLTSKNVAAEIAEKLCESVGGKLIGQHINTWTNVKRFARDALEEAVLRILNPSRNINILREIQTKTRPPYVIVFCGVNGVGKSTNLAKIANWLINNQVKVLVVACDTFRAGAIEQLRTHVMALKSLHEKGKKGSITIELFERGYGRDSAAIAMEAINYARANQFNCVMVDTAGRMQDNEPLMRQLAKLIKINTPDLTLFVGEALVGNEAVDQLTKFNNSLLDCGCRIQESSHSAINGIVLTKFDTIDDQVGAAISMTYVTGQPIVFVGVGQTYRDLKQLDAKAVTKSLMR